MTNNLTFQDLTFFNHRDGGKQSRIDFVNGHWFSILGGSDFHYGNGIDTFELFTSEHDDTEAWAEVDRINEVLQDMQEKHGEIKEINFGI
jgi:hypothetical protein